MRIGIFIFFIIIYCSVVIADESEKQKNDELSAPPHFRMIGSTTGNSVLSMQCEGKAPYEEIQCHFTQIRFRKMTEEEKQKFRKENVMRHEKMTQKEFTDYISVLTDPNDLNKIEERAVKAPTFEKKAYLKDALDNFKFIASAKNKDQLKEALKKMNQMEEDTCSISLHEADSTFRRVTRNRWISNPGPVGLCNVIRVQTLENTPEYPMLWKITETVVSSDNDGLCEGIQSDKPTIYSWEAPTSVMLGCKYLSFRP